MGSGASSVSQAEAVKAIKDASDDDLRIGVQSLSIASREKLNKELIACQGTDSHPGASSAAVAPADSETASEKDPKQAAAASSAPALAEGVPEDGGAGGAEITGDDELAFELNQQELLFQKCMRNRMEREAKKKQEKQAKKEADEKARKAALEDAFDGEVDKLLAFFGEGFAIETMDGYGTTLLSEAAAGGSDDVIQVLLGNGANPNKRGRNRRTPLWRAANAGHPGAVQLLLRAGGDPRTPDETGSKPYHVANGAEVKSLLECWDVSVTEAIRQVMGANQKKLEREKKEKQKKQKQEMGDALEAAERKAQIAKTEVAKIQKRVVSYRQQRVSHAETGEIAKLEELTPLLENAEGELEVAKRVHQDLEWQVKRAKLKVRDFENKMRRLNRKAGDVTTKLEQVIFLKDLSDVVVKDVGGKRRDDGRWPLIFDPSGKAEVFFNYCGAVVFRAEDLACQMASSDKAEQRLLLVALLKHLKYGGSVVISVGKDMEQFEIVEQAFNEIEKGFFNTLMDRSVLFSYLLPRRFDHLIPSDLKDEYSEFMFDDENISKFVLAFLVSGNEPEPEVMEKDCHMYYTIKVQDPDAEKEEEEEEPADDGGD